VGQCSGPASLTHACWKTRVTLTFFLSGQAIHPDVLYKIAEEHNISQRAYEELIGLLNRAVSKASGTPANACDNLLPAAEIYQEMKNNLNREMLQVLKPQHPARNPGCVLELAPCMQTASTCTKSTSDTMYYVMHLDGNTSNYKEQLYLAVRCVTDYVHSADGDSEVACMLGSQNPSNVMDVAVIGKHPYLKDKDIEDPKVCSKFTWRVLQQNN
jgi:hypothetical protein